MKELSIRFQSLLFWREIGTGNLFCNVKLVYLQMVPFFNYLSAEILRRYF